MKQRKKIIQYSISVVIIGVMIVTGIQVREGIRKKKSESTKDILQEEVIEKKEDVNEFQDKNNEQQKNEMSDIKHLEDRKEIEYPKQIKQPEKNTSEENTQQSSPSSYEENKDGDERNVANQMIEEHRQLYQIFLNKTLLLEYGVSQIKDVSLACAWYEGAVDLKEYLPEEQKGILGAKFYDLNQDGIQELIVICAETFTVGLGIDAYDYDGIQLLVYTIKENQVVPLEIPKYVSEFPYIFAYGQDEIMEIALKEHLGNRYLVIYEKCLLETDTATDILQVIVLQMKDMSLECVRYAVITDGYVLDRKEIADIDMDTIIYYDSRGQEETKERYNSIYEAFSSEMEEFGLSFGKLKTYLNEVKFDEEMDIISFQNNGKKEELYPSLESMNSSIEQLVSIKQSCENANTQKISIKDNTNIRELLGIEYFPYGKTREYNRLTYFKEEKQE